MGTSIVTCLLHWVEMVFLPLRVRISHEKPQLKYTAMKFVNTWMLSHSS